MKFIWLVAMGGFIGAAARYFIANKIKPINGFPISTLFVNLLGSFLLGLISGAVLDSKLSLLIGIGILGSFTTFSTFKVEMVSLLEEKKWYGVVSYAAASYFGGILFAFGGYLIGKYLA